MKAPPEKEARVVFQMEATPEQTAKSWDVLPGDALTLNWAEIAMLATQHRVEGILEDALKLAGCADQIPTSVMSGLRRRADLADARYQACYQALLSLWEAAPKLTSELVFFKGAMLASLYESPHHRMLGDFDLIIASEQVDDLRQTLESLGYWEKPGRNGPTFFGERASPQIGAEVVCFDVHVASPPKYNRTPSSLNSLWLEDTEFTNIGEVHCRRLSTELELLELLVHASEHATSWIHICLDDDIRLIRLLDIELVCERGTIDTERVARLSMQLGLQGEMALGLAQLAQLRGRLPQALASLQPYADAAEPYLDYVALPDGRIERFPAPMSRRAFMVNRSSLALCMMPEGRRHRRQWFDWRSGLIEGSEDVASIARLVQQRIREAVADQ